MFTISAQALRQRLHSHLPRTLYSTIQPPDMAKTNISNAAEKIAERSTDLPWYDPSIGSKLGASTREVLENYSKIPGPEVEAHVYAIVPPPPPPSPCASPFASPNCSPLT